VFKLKGREKKDRPPGTGWRQDGREAKERREYVEPY
jgi:hypothetical protein